ncbi:glycosyltransferase family 39 protein [bacterium]|nr:MAG: glycosyltransferase family 39 protein [bacterium]
MPTTLFAPTQSQTKPATQLPPVEAASLERKRTGSWVWLLIFALTIFVYLGTTGALPIVGRDEPRYVQIGREMLDSGDWVTPRLGGYTWFEKPIMLYWMVAASFGVFGVSEWAARLGPALCGLGTIAAVWWMARRVDEKWARWSALSLATSGALLSFSHGATFDIPLTACVTLALASFFLAQVDRPKDGQYLALFWVGIGLAFMAKGLVAFILTLGTVGLYALIRRERVRHAAIWGLPLALAVAALWFGPVIAANGESFIKEFFIEHHFARYLSDKYKHHQPIYFYLLVLPLFALPWTPFLVMGLLRSRLSALREDTLESRLQAFALAWLIVPIAFFSLSGSKLPGYILPAIPGAFLLVGLAIRDWAISHRRIQLAGGLALAILFATCLVTTLPIGIARADKSSTRSLFHAAHSKGYGGLRVVQFQITERTSQFYAASHLLYDASGEPLRIDEPAPLAELVKAEPMLVLTDMDQIEVLNAVPNLKFQKLADNGKRALLLASYRPR